jgi:hypothetical protein
MTDAVCDVGNSNPAVVVQLGAEFEVRLEGPHVVNMKKQVYAGVMLSGPAGNPLQATYRFTGDVSFQVKVLTPPPLIITPLCLTQPGHLAHLFHTVQNLYLLYGNIICYF